MLRKIKVLWEDALIYSPETLSVLNLKPTSKITKGILVKENSEGIIVKDPYTIFEENRKRDSREELIKKATFLFIPNGMIKEII
jgi:hypothetical protein